MLPIDVSLSVIKQLWSSSSQNALTLFSLQFMTSLRPPTPFPLLLGGWAFLAEIQEIHLSEMKEKCIAICQNFTLSLIFMDLFNAIENWYHKTVKGFVLQCLKVYQTALFPRCSPVVLHNNVEFRNRLCRGSGNAKCLKEVSPIS